MGRKLIKKVLCSLTHTFTHTMREDSWALWRYESSGPTLASGNCWNKVTRFFMDASVSLKLITIKDIHIYVHACACAYTCMSIHTCTYMCCVCVYTYIWQAVAKPVGHILMDRTPNLVRHHIPFLWLALILYSSFYSLRIWDSEVLLPCSPARFLTPPALLFSLIELQCSRGRWGLN